MDQKFCTKCGSLLRKNAKFCIKCGTPVKNIDDVKPQTNNSLIIDNLKTQNKMEYPPEKENTSTIIPSVESDIPKQKQEKSVKEIEKSNEPNKTPREKVKPTVDIGDRSTNKSGVEAKNPKAQTTNTPKSRVCRICGNTAFDDNDTCVYCGTVYVEPDEKQPSMDVNKSKQTNGPKNPVKSQRQQSSQINELIHGTIITCIVVVIALGAIYAISISGNFYNPANKSKSSNVTQQVQKKPEAINISAQNLMAEFIQDQPAANEKYKHKEMVITGTVTWKGNFNNTDKTYGFNIYDWRYEGKHYAVLASVPNEKTDIINNIQVGDNVMVKGSCGGIWGQQSSSYIVVGVNVTSMVKI